MNSVNVYGFDKYSTISISFKMVSIEINKSKKEINKKRNTFAMQANAEEMIKKNCQEEELCG